MRIVTLLVNHNSCKQVSKLNGNAYRKEDRQTGRQQANIQRDKPIANKETCRKVRIKQRG